MAEDNRRESARTVKTQEAPKTLLAAVLLLANLARGIVEALFDDHVIQADRVYLRRQVIRKCRIHKHTFERWRAAGLRVSSPGTKQEYVVGADVLEFLRNPPEMPEPYKSPHAERNKTRRRKV